MGLKKYGVSIDECLPPTGCFRLDTIEELLDGMQYIVRDCTDKDEEIQELKETIESLETEVMSLENDLAEAEGDPQDK